MPKPKGSRNQPMAQAVTMEVESFLMGLTKAALADLVVDLVRGADGADLNGEELINAIQGYYRPVSRLRATAAVMGTPEPENVSGDLPYYQDARSALNKIRRGPQGVNHEFCLRFAFSEFCGWGQDKPNRRLTNDQARHTIEDATGHPIPEGFTCGDPNESTESILERYFWLVYYGKKTEDRAHENV